MSHLDHFDCTESTYSKFRHRLRSDGDWIVLSFHDVNLLIDSQNNLHSDTIQLGILLFFSLLKSCLSHSCFMVQRAQVGFKPQTARQQSCMLEKEIAPWPSCHDQHQSAEAKVVARRKIRFYVFSSIQCTHQPTLLSQCFWFRLKLVVLLATVAPPLFSAPKKNQKNVLLLPRASLPPVCRQTDRRFRANVTD